MENKQDKGFTLVELLIVIVILGILATVTVFAVRGITDQGQTSACDADKKTMQTAIESYFAQNGGSTIPGSDPTQTLIDADFIVSASENYDVTAAGTLTYADVGATDGTDNPCLVGTLEDGDAVAP